MTVASNLAIASAAGEIVTIAVLLYRRIWRTFPMFSIFMVWAFVSDLIGLHFLLSRSDAAYFSFFRLQMVIDSVAMFAVLVELFWSVLRPMRSSLPRGTIVFLALLIAGAGLFIWPLAGTTMDDTLSHNAFVWIQLQQTMAILRIVCFLVMAGFSQVLAIGWRDRELQVATGFGFYSIVSLLVAILESHQYTDAKYHWLDYAVSASYLGTMAYWVVSFSIKEQERKEFSPQMQQFLLQMGGGVRAGRIALTDLPAERSKLKDK